MTTITYLLHRFPRVTDTFIVREIRSLVRAGATVKVISVWTPRQQETTTDLLADWASDLTFLLPASVGSIAVALTTELFINPRRFFLALKLALQTSRPGFAGFGYQMFYLAEAMLAAKYIRANKTRHLHNHFGDQSGTVTMLAGILTATDYSISFHGPHIFFGAEGSSLNQKVSRALFTRCISYYCRSQLMVVAQSPDTRSKKVIHCGLDLSEYSFENPRLNVKTIFCSARLAPEKGIEFLLQAFKIVHQNHDGIRLRIAGDGPCRSSLEVIAVDLEISHYVEFLGQLQERQITTELSASDLFVLPSLAEGLPVSLMEAMAVGVPVIATNVAGVSELIEDGESGFLVPPTNALVLAAKILIAIGDHGLRVRVAERGRQKIEEEFDIHLEAAKLGLMFDEAVNG